MDAINLDGGGSTKIWIKDKSVFNFLPMHQLNVLSLMPCLLFAFSLTYGQSDLTSSSGNKKTENADIKAIRSIIQQWQGGYNSGQAAKVAVLYTQDAIVFIFHL
jgi:hypothetical protein